jgi:hypothetical protein
VFQLRRRGFAALICVAVPLVGACTRPPTMPPTTTTTPTSPGGLPAPQGQNCGTIIIGETPAETSAQAVSCFHQYHSTVASTYLVTVKKAAGSTTSTAYQGLAGHSVTVTEIVTDASGAVTSNKAKHCDGGAAQIILNNDGTVLLSTCTP